MERKVDATIPVEPEAAAALADARNREAAGRLASRVLRTCMTVASRRKRTLPW
jgi:hypothetical protein